MQGALNVRTVKRIKLPALMKVAHRYLKIVRSILRPSAAAARIISGGSPRSAKVVRPWDDGTGKEKERDS
ncbi:hypothetical protein ASL20_21035 [Cupriavidus necator]|nr:hypothetical protein ASL20_21035 [Cupriavidus necator]